MKAIRLHLKQNSANYRKEETVNCRMTYPLPPYSTVIGALHKACGYTEYHPMQLSIQGKYSSMTQKLFKEDCFLNSLQDDRGMLVKMKNPHILSSAYVVVASAQKSQGNSFDKGITINVANQQLLDEYRFLNRTRKRIELHKKKIKTKKNNLKLIKENSEISEEEFKNLSNKLKRLEKAYKQYEEHKYTIPKSYFRTLTKAPKWYEILCDVELIIHIVSDEKTMSDILENISNLTAIGRGEDFVQVINACQVELTEYESPYRNENFSAYIPCDVIENNNKALSLLGSKEGIVKNGTRYLINKDYKLEGKPGAYKRIFNKIPVLCTVRFRVKSKIDGVLFDKYNNSVYPVFLV
ncbi:MAG: CRISPR-associated protein Cas5 [Ruminococcus sp.]|nr:CRISPR-associated protein Cas5 [Ruminococcus sp.]